MGTSRIRNNVDVKHVAGPHEKDGHFGGKLLDGMTSKKKKGYC